MAIILGIDAAWTPGQPSGVALIDSDRNAKCVAVSPSYQAFLDVSVGRSIDWEARQPGGKPPLDALLDAARDLAGVAVDVIAVDMPVATVPINSRRAADTAISVEFGGRWCSAHSPSSLRPGAIGARLSEEAVELGYSLATAATQPGTAHRLVEVYPHPALLTLLGSAKRVPYKISRARKYWPEAQPDERRARIREKQRSIELKLSEILGPLPLPSLESEVPLSSGHLKRREDAIDAIVSAWVGLLYLEGSATPYGDETAAVWCP